MKNKAPRGGFLNEILEKYEAPHEVSQMKYLNVLRPPLEFFKKPVVIVLEGRDADLRVGRGILTRADVTLGDVKFTQPYRGFFLFGEFLRERKGAESNGTAGKDKKYDFAFHFHNQHCATLRFQDSHRSPRGESGFQFGSWARIRT